MKKLLTYCIIVAMICLIGSSADAKERFVPLTIKNNTDSTIVVKVEWINHPHGCFNSGMFTTCSFDICGAELKPGESFTINLKNGYLDIGNIFRVKAFKAWKYNYEVVLKTFKITHKTIDIEVDINELPEEKEFSNYYRKRFEGAQPNIWPPWSGFQR